VLEKPIISSRKVYIIKDADSMTKEAGNCLLKTLEEPPSFITIIMTGSNESKFLNTIKSRCMKVSFKKIPDNILKEYLKNEHDIDLSNQLIKACEGSIEKALKINEKKEEYEELTKIFSNVENYRLLDVVKKLEFLYNSKEEIEEILSYINLVLSFKIIENSTYIKYINIVEQTKNRLSSNANYDMSIDSMIYKIWEE